MQQGNGPQSPLRRLSVLFFHLLLAHSCTGQSQLIAPSQPIVAKVGDDIILPCHLETEVDVVAMTLEWTRSDLNPKFVHMRRASQDLLRIQHPSYKGRTSVSIDELKHGNVSLKLSRVKPSDAGRYKCYIPKLDTGSVVELVVGAASSLVISLSEIVRNKGAVVLQCESTGWYPEPEVFWLDAEGNLLSAGPTETVRGPDDLYTVSSRVTVERRHSNSFTCRVQQNHINQTRETLIHVPDDFFEVQSSSSSTTVGLAVSLAVCILVILILGFFVWKFKTKRSCRDQTNEGDKKNHSKRNRNEDHCVTEEETETQQLMTHPTVQKEDLNKSKLKEEQQRRQEAENKVQALDEEQQKTREEQQRREAAENRVKTLEEELETKKTELQKKQADLQQLHEEKQRKEENLQRLKEHLEKKNTEVKTAEAALTKHSWLSSSSKKEKEQKKKMEAEKEVETLKKQLETGETELVNKTKEINDKQVQVQQLQEEIQRMETDLKILMEELSNNMKMMGNNDETNRKLLQEAQREVRTLKSQLESKNTEFEKKQAEVQQFKEGIKETETNLQTLLEDLESNTLESGSNTAPSVQSGAVQPVSLLKWPFILRQKFQEKLQMKITEFEKKQAEVQQLHTDVQMMITDLQSLMKDLESNTLEFGSNRTTQVQSGAVQPVSLSQWPFILRQKFQEKLQMKITELKEIKQAADRQSKKNNESDGGSPSPGQQNEKRESEQQDSSSPSSTTGPAVGVKVDPYGKYIQLINTSNEDQQLGGWALQIQVNDSETIKHTFEDSFNFKAGQVFPVRYCSYADKVQVSLISGTGKIQYNYSY